MSAVLVAFCDNLIEPEGTTCTGRLRYRWGQSEAACDTCGGRCGIAVASWKQVDQEAVWIHTKDWQKDV